MDAREQLLHTFKAEDRLEARNKRERTEGISLFGDIKLGRNVTPRDGEIIRDWLNSVDWTDLAKKLNPLANSK